MIIEKVLGKIDSFEIGNRTVVPVMLSHDQLAKPHQKVKAENGDVYAISLPYGDSLFTGAVIFADDETVVAIDLIPEKVIEIRPQGNLQWAKAAFNMGNMHQAAYLQEDAILVAYDPILEKMIAEMKISYLVTEKKLDGIRANHTHGMGHHHHHDHHEAHGHHHHDGGHHHA